MNKKEYDIQYHKEHVKKLGVDLPKDLVDQFKDACIRKGKTMTEVIRTAIEKFIAE